MFKLNLEDLPPGPTGEYFIPDWSVNSRYDVIFLLGRKSRIMGRELHITHRKVDGGEIVSWIPAREITYDNSKRQSIFS